MNVVLNKYETVTLNKYEFELLNCMPDAIIR